MSDLGALNAIQCFKHENGFQHSKGEGDARGRYPPCTPIAKQGGFAFFFLGN